MTDRRLCVLVVDDDRGIRDSLADLFEDQGYDAHSAANGLDALDCLTRIRPSIVILDLMMPVMNGWELYQRMKADPALSSIPICVLSVSTSRLPDAECVLNKPISVTRLLEAIQQHAVGA